MQLVSQFEVQSTNDLAFVHWGQGTVAPASVITLYPQHFPRLPPPEFYYFAKSIGQPNPTLSLNQSTFLLTVRSSLSKFFKNNKTNKLLLQSETE